MKQNKNTLLADLLAEISPEQQKLTTEKMKAEIRGWEAAFDKILNILEEDILAYYIDEDHVRQNALQRLFDKIEKLRDE